MSNRMHRLRWVSLGSLLLLVLVVAGGPVVTAQKPPPSPEAVEAASHCAPWGGATNPNLDLPVPAEVRAELDAATLLVRVTWRDLTDLETCYGVLRGLPPPPYPTTQEQITLATVVPADTTEAFVPAIPGRSCYPVYAGNAAGQSVPSSIACVDATDVLGPAPPPPLLPGASPPPPPLAAPGLLTRNREALAICVNGVGPAANAVSEAVARVERALQHVAQHPAWTQAGFAAVSQLVAAGCPHEPYLLEPGVYWEDGIPITGVGRVVPEASVYSLFVFLLPPEELDRVIHGRLAIRSAAEEMLCAGHQCWEVTTGVYLTPDEAFDEPFLVEWLTKGLGLEPIRPLETPPDVPRGR